MKKLMIAAVAVVCATVASAATFDWKTAATGGKVYVAGSTETTLSSATAYLFNSATVSQLALLQNFYANGTLSSGSITSKSVADGKIAGTSGGSFTYDTASLDAYFAIISGDKLFISDVATVAAKDVGYNTAQYKATAASQEAATVLSENPTAFAGTGWYSVSSEPGPGPQSGPEPTSGLLLLVGGALLGLRRRRA